MIYQDYVLPDTQLTMTAYEFNKALERVKADERERIIELLEEHSWFEKGEQDTIIGMLDGSYECDCKGCAPLINGETK